jgi:hypothetical protein
MPGADKSSRLLLPSWASEASQKRLVPVESALYFCLLYGASGVDSFRTDNATLTDEGAIPRGVVQPDPPVSLCLPLIAGIVVVALGKRKYGGPEKMTVVFVYRASSKAEHAINTETILLEISELGRCLQVFALLHRLLIRTNNPRLDLGQLFHEVVEGDYEVTLDGKVGEWFNPNRAREIVTKERGAGQLRDTI